MKKIAVFTGTRAEYGLLYWLLKELDTSSLFELQLIVSGMHLSPEFGSTIQFIEEDGFKIDAKVEMLLSSSSPVGTAKSMGVGVIGFADTLDRLKPDCLIILGDRFEAFAIAQTAMVMQIPIGHIHGGELTEGLIDEAIRHSITKMAQLHFTSTDQYRKRVIQLGEDPSRVFNIGALSIENVHRLKPMTKKELESSIGFDIGMQPILLTFHPVTLEKDGGVSTLGNLLNVLEDFARNKKIIITYPNADNHGRELIRLLENFADKHKEQVMLSKSLGQVRYLSLVKLSGVVIGNSSSSLFDAPALGVPSVDIGIRQKGRVKPDSVVHCAEDVQSIHGALNTALSDLHRKKAKSVENPYGNGKVTDKLVKILTYADFESMVFKKFYDMEEL